MTEKYRTRSGFKVPGTPVHRYLVPRAAFLNVINKQLKDIGCPTGVHFSIAKPNDAEKIVAFMQSSENRTERFPEDDFHSAWLKLKNMTTLLAADVNGQVVGCATISRVPGKCNKISAAHAVSDGIFYTLAHKLVTEHPIIASDKVILAVYELRTEVLKIVSSIEGAELVAKMDQSFTKYNEYPAEIMKWYYCR